MKERFPWAAAIAVVAAWCLAFVAFSFSPPSRNDSLYVLDKAWKSFALFTLQSDPSPEDHWLLVIARIFAPMATLGAIYAVSRTYITRGFHAFLLRRMRGHTIVIGLGTRGRAFRDSCGSNVAVLDMADPGQPQKRRSGRVLCWVGDGRDPDALRHVGIDHAATVLVLTGDDAVNLEIVSVVIECRRNVRLPLLVAVRLQSQSLARQLDRQDDFVRRGLGHDIPQTQDDARIEVMPFAAERVATQQLLMKHPLVDLAVLRGLRRVHVVVLGWTGFALAFLEQLARTAPYDNFDVPRVDLFVSDPATLRAEIASVQPAFLADLHISAEVLDDGEPHRGAAAGSRVLEIHLHGLGDVNRLPTPEQIEAIEPGPNAQVTAVLVTLGNDAHSAALALGLRDRCNREGRWHAPVFVEMAQGAASFSSGAANGEPQLSLDSTFATVLQKRARLLDPAERIIPVGTMTGTCNIEHIAGSREEAARTLHAAYLRTRGRQLAPLDSRASNEMPWPLLAQTYRNANRRAVDHLTVKLLSADYVTLDRSTRTVPAPVVIDPEQIETLAQLEHRSWEVDRVLDGWRGGAVRDDRSRVNETIGVPFDSLPEAIRAFDVQQVSAAVEMLNDRGCEARREFRVALLGHNHVRSQDKAAIVSSIVSLPPLAAAIDSGALISLVTPLAPGSDVILAEAISRTLQEQKADYRVVVVRALPFEVVLSEFLASAEPSAEWSLRGEALPADPQRAATLIRSYLEQWLLDRPSAVIANLLPPGLKREDWLGASNADRRRAAFRRANGYLVSRAHMLVAFYDDTRPSRPGGSGEALAWARDPTSIPNEYRVSGDTNRARAPMIVVVPPPETS